MVDLFSKININLFENGINIFKIKNQWYLQYIINENNLSILEIKLYNISNEFKNNLSKLDCFTIPSHFIKSFNFNDIKKLNICNGSNKLGLFDVNLITKNGIIDVKIDCLPRKPINFINLYNKNYEFEMEISYRLFMDVMTQFSLFATKLNFLINDTKMVLECDKANLSDKIQKLNCIIDENYYEYISCDENLVHFKASFNLNHIKKSLEVLNLHKENIVLNLSPNKPMLIEDKSKSIKLYISACINK